MHKLKNLSVVIFRYNLRLKDNASLFNGVQANENVVALFPLEILDGYSLGFKQYGKFKKEFLFQTLVNLKENLLQKNIKLYCIKDATKTFEILNQSFNIKIYFDQEVGVQEKKFEQKLTLYPHQSYFTQTMIEPFSFDFTKSFSHFRKKAQKQIIQEPLGAIDFVQNNLLTYHIEDTELQLSQTPIPFIGGEDKADKRVDYYFKNHLHSYIDTRALIDGEDISTSFSPYLSVGAISARTVYKKLKEYEAKTYSSKSSYWIYFELLWRDFFYLVMQQSDNKLFLKTGLSNIQYDFKEDISLLDSFFSAKTGVDIIDAGVIELTTTGWISNRQRQLLANYFCKYLGLDFRYGAAFFEKYLIDYNPASNYGNWAYQAGVGNDKTYRVFDILKQSAQYKGKAYIKKWLNKDEENKIDLKNQVLKTKYEVYKIGE